MKSRYQKLLLLLTICFFIASPAMVISKQAESVITDSNILALISGVSVLCSMTYIVYQLLKVKQSIGFWIAYSSTFVALVALFFLTIYSFYTGSEDLEAFGNFATFIAPGILFLSILLKSNASIKEDIYVVQLTNGKFLTKKFKL